MTDKIIRYTKQDMLFLHDSPLVQKPESMPSLASWFGEDANSPTPKSILNGTVITRAADKSIVLGPTKTNFASSSLHSGLKNDSNLRKPQTRYGNRQLEDTRNYIKDFKQPRSPSTSGERGFSQRSFDNNNNNHNHHNHNHNHNHNHSNSSSNNGNNGNNGNNNNSNGRGDTKKYVPASPHSRRNDRHSDKSRRDHTNNQFKHHTNGYEQENTEKVPEWMDYSPEIEKETKKEQPQFVNDLEAWKADMKKKNDTVDNQSLPKQQQQQQQQQTQTKQQQKESPSPSPSSPPLSQQQLTSMDQRERGLEDFMPPLKLSSQNSQEPTDFFDDTDLITQRENSKGGSRFAKFFAKRDETPKEQARSISVNDLFQGQQNGHQMSPPLPPSNQQNGPQIVSNQPRALSEEEVLKSLGAQKVNQELATDNTNANANANANSNSNKEAIGFNRILQILSQPKPSTTQPPSSAELSPPLNESRPKSTTSTSTVPSNNNISTPPPTTSHNRFGNNLPTSVLRQMSARSSEGRSPSLSSTKPTTPSMHYSPVQQQQQQQQLQQQHRQQPQSQHQQPQLHQQHQQQPSIKPIPPYPVNNNNYSPHLPMMDPHVYEQQLHQYANNELLHSPVLPPHLTFRQQPRNEPFMPQVQPGALPPGAPRPMMPPHLPPHLQYQQRFPLQDMMPPIPPHMMTNGMPPMFTKNQGWDRQ